VLPKTLRCKNHCRQLRHQPGGGLLCATDHGWRQAACCRCHTKRCLRLQVVPAGAAANAASSTDPANCHLQVQQGTPPRAARLGLRTTSVTVREKETHLKQQNWASWPDSKSGLRGV
jgi:hypothetical protein